MSILEIIIVLTTLAEILLGSMLILEKTAEYKGQPHLIVRSRKYPRSRRDAQGTWVID